MRDGNTTPEFDAESDESGHDAPSRLATLSWGLAGFIIGAVFWHFIGFWGFVNDIVLKGRPDDGRIVAQAGQDCTEAWRDRATGEVKLIACPLHAPQMAEMASRGREDSDLIARRKKLDTPRWSILVSQDGEEGDSSR